VIALAGTGDRHRPEWPIGMAGIRRGGAWHPIKRLTSALLWDQPPGSLRSAQWHYCETLEQMARDDGTYDRGVGSLVAGCQKMVKAEAQ
jgi:hypothetical protein